MQELSGTGAVLANLLTGLGIDEPFTRSGGPGTRTLLGDALGSTLALADDTGAVQTTYTYEPFGTSSVITPPAPHTAARWSRRHSTVISGAVSISSCDRSTSSYEMGLQRVATLAAQRSGLPHDQKRQREEQSLAYGPAARTA